MGEFEPQRRRSAQGTRAKSKPKKSTTTSKGTAAKARQTGSIKKATPRKTKPVAKPKAAAARKKVSQKTVTPAKRGRISKKPIVSTYKSRKTLPKASGSTSKTLQVASTSWGQADSAASSDIGQTIEKTSEAQGVIAGLPDGSHLSLLSLSAHDSHAITSQHEANGISAQTTIDSPQADQLCPEKKPALDQKLPGKAPNDQVHPKMNPITCVEQMLHPAACDRPSESTLPQVILDNNTGGTRMSRETTYSSQEVCSNRTEAQSTPQTTPERDEELSLV
jgi:hypothetical protein